MPIVLHARRELERALQARERAKLRLVAVQQSLGWSGAADVRRAFRRARCAYHQASLTALDASIRDSRWHVATHRAAIVRAA